MLTWKKIKAGEYVAEAPRGGQYRARRVETRTHGIFWNLYCPGVTYPTDREYTLTGVKEIAEDYTILSIIEDPRTLTDYLIATIRHRHPRKMIFRGDLSGAAMSITDDEPRARCVRATMGLAWLWNTLAAKQPGYDWTIPGHVLALVHDCLERPDLLPILIDALEDISPAPRSLGWSVLADARDCWHFVQLEMAPV